MKKILGLLCLLALAGPLRASGTTYYISPLNGPVAGSDSNNGLSGSAPFLTWDKAFRSMSCGDALVMLDGSASTQAASGMGIMNDASGFSGSSQPVSGCDSSHYTVVMASHSGGSIVEVDSASTIAPFFIGRSTVHKQYIKVVGFRFIGGGSQIYNGDHIYISSCGFYGVSQDGGDVFSIGTIDHNGFNSYNLIEDSWFRGKNRIIALNYRAGYNVWRRCVIKSDGCSSSNCQGSGNPNVGFTVYNSSHVSIQNLSVVDYVLGSGAQPYADFASAQHDPGAISRGNAEALGMNEWLGCISLHSQNGGHTFEGDAWQASTPSWIVKNFVSWDSQGPSFNFQNQATQTTSGTLAGFTFGYSSGTSNDNVRIVNNGTAHGGIVQNGIATRGARYNINSSVTPSFVDTFGSTTSAFNQTSCSVGCQTGDPLADTGPSLKYLVRIEAGSTLSGQGSGGSDIGATIVNQYGTTGTFYDDAAFDTLSNTPLWANGYPNDDRMWNELCTGDSTSRLCTTSGSTNRFRKRIMEALGNPDPYISGGGGGGGSAATNLGIQMKGVTLQGVRIGG